jgi:RNA polymerase sigma-70 factor, ECF subfamily
MRLRPVETYSQQSDEQLLRLVAQGEVAAYELFYDRHAQTVYSLLVRIVRERAIADELLQETFWQVWRNAESYRGNGAAAAWLLRIARNRALDELRRQKARPQRVDDAPAQVENEFQRQGGAADQDLQRYLDQRQVQQALATLPADQRTCLELGYFDGLTHREIAEQLDLPAGTVKSRMRLALEKMERLLRGQGYP